MSHALMHDRFAKLDDLPVQQLDEVRYQLKLTKAQLCELSGINPATYQRWMRYMQGRKGGSCPHPRTLKAVREVLKAEVRRQFAA